MANEGTSFQIYLDDALKYTRKTTFKVCRRCQSIEVVVKIEKLTMPRTDRSFSIATERSKNSKVENVEGFVGKKKKKIK